MISRAYVFALICVAACSGERSGMPLSETAAAGSDVGGAAAAGAPPPVAGQAPGGAPAPAGAPAPGANGATGMPAATAGAPAGGSTGAGAAGTAGSAGAAGAAAHGGVPDASAAGASAAGASAPDAATAPSLPPVDSTQTDGPFDAMQDLRGGPQGRSGVFHPVELGAEGLKHPVFVWGCGGGSTPMQYADQLRRIATHGFIVIAEVSAIGDDGAPLKASLEWILAENERMGSPFFQVVATTKLALGGHSIGSVNAFMIADDPRLTTTIHIAGGSLDDVNDPFAPTTGMGGKRLIHPVAYICSMSDTFGNVEKTEKDYENTTAPAWMTVMTGVDHVAAARSGLPATIAWLRWHLAGEDERRAAFLEPGGEFTTGIFVSRHKNW